MALYYDSDNSGASGSTNSTSSDSYNERFRDVINDVREYHAYKQTKHYALFFKRGEGGWRGLCEEGVGCGLKNVCQHPREIT